MTPASNANKQMERLIESPTRPVPAPRRTIHGSARRPPATTPAEPRGRGHCDSYGAKAPGNHNSGRRRPPPMRMPSPSVSALLPRCFRQNQPQCATGRRLADSPTPPWPPRAGAPGGLPRPHARGVSEEPARSTERRVGEPAHSPSRPPGRCSSAQASRANAQDCRDLLGGGHLSLVLICAGCRAGVQRFFGPPTPVHLECKVHDKCGHS